MISASKLVTTLQVLIKRFDSTETIHSIIICNRNSNARDITLWFVPANTTTADEHQVLSSIEIYGNETLVIELNDVRMGPFEEIYAQGGASATFSITVMNNA